MGISNTLCPIFAASEARVIESQTNREISPDDPVEGVPWAIEVMGLHGTLLEGVPWPIEGMGLHGTLF